MLHLRGPYFPKVQSRDILFPVKTCPRCAKENEQDNIFCGRCGLDFSEYKPDIPRDDGEAHFCYRHPKERTELSCGRCGKYLCAKCVVIGPAGPRCRDCAKNKIPIRARAVVGDAKIGFRRIFSAGPFAIYWWFLIASMLFGMVRGCMYLTDRKQPPPAREHSVPDDDPEIRRT